MSNGRADLVVVCVTCRCLQVKSRDARLHVVDTVQYTQFSADCASCIFSHFTRLSYSDERSYSTLGPVSA